MYLVSRKNSFSISNLYRGILPRCLLPTDPSFPSLQDDLPGLGKQRMHRQTSSQWHFSKRGKLNLKHVKRGKMINFLLFCIIYFYSENAWFHYFFILFPFTHLTLISSLLTVHHSLVVEEGIVQYKICLYPMVFEKCVWHENISQVLGIGYFFFSFFFSICQAVTVH